MKCLYKLPVFLRWHNIRHLPVHNVKFLLNPYIQKSYNRCIDVHNLCVSIILFISWCFENVVIRLIPLLYYICTYLHFFVHRAQEHIYVVAFKYIVFLHMLQMFNHRKVQNIPFVFNAIYPSFYIVCFLSYDVCCKLLGMNLGYYYVSRIF